MADVKWIKITTDIFDDEKIKIIDTMPARDEILVIWFKLLALTGKINQNGMLFINNKIPYTQEMLSAVFNRELNVVKLSLDTFYKFGMIEIEDNEVICIANWGKHQNIDGLEKIRLQTKERVKKTREKKKQLLLEDCNATCNATVTQSNATDIELELEKDNKNIYISEIIFHLNNKTGKAFKPSTEKTKSCLNARWNEGFTELEEYKTVIDKKCNEWLKDETMEKFLRPETLFGTKFESYINEKQTKPKQQTNHYSNGFNDYYEED